MKKIPKKLKKEHEQFDEAVIIFNYVYGQCFKKKISLKVALAAGLFTCRVLAKQMNLDLKMYKKIFACTLEGYKDDL